MPGDTPNAGRDPNEPVLKPWKEKGPWKMPRWELEEDLVISGMSGRYPESDNVEELKNNLFGAVDMITENDRRWEPGLFETPRRSGKLKDITNFDSLFFGVHGKLAEIMDPQQRLLLEVTYEAIFDAGYEPSTLRGKNIGVFVGCCDRTSIDVIQTDRTLNGYELLGFNLGMMANRISFTFDFKGPSFTVDTACSASFHALNEAMLAIKTNRCQAAIVGGSTISINPIASHTFAKLGLTSMDGTCRVFDANAKGYVRSETVSVIFLQKASDARRSYGSVMHCKLNNDGSKPEGISFPSAEVQTQLYREVYSELDMDPSTIDFLEAHGTGTVAGDREESNAIGDFFCLNRETPLRVGSVKSNIGHAEAASGLGSIAKVILSMENGEIPPNLHYTEPNCEVPALIEGKMQVVTKVTPWKPGIVAINNFGFGGSNAHMVFRCNQIEKPERKDRVIPRLALVCGRSESGVKKIFKAIDDLGYSDEAIVLLEEACKAPTFGMRYRGYGLVKNPGDETQVVIERAPVERRPVWFLFSGMGSQWSGMAKSMMKLDLFAQSIRRSAEILNPLGLDLIHLLTEAAEEDLNHIVAPFVTIAAVQIALIDVVKALGIEPDGIIGHSVGELGCAFADGCFTPEQMLLAAYWRGKSCERSKLVKGAMAAIGMTWEEAKTRCPKGVYAVCHNAEDSVTISGPADLVKQFVQELGEENIFARVVKTCDIAFHSCYVTPAADIMRKELAKVIPNPVPRSTRWVSSSVPEEEWGEPKAQLSSVDYHINNLLSPVLFQEAMEKVPKNAIVIEFAPHSLLNAIVKRILGPEAIYVGLMKRNHEDNLLHFLESVGRLYLSHLNPCAKNLYEAIKFPVPRGTPMLNSLIQWEHPNSWLVNDFKNSHKNKDFYQFDTFKGNPDEYLLGHKVDGRVFFPAMGYVFQIWSIYLKIKLKKMTETPVVIEDIIMQRAILLPKNGIFRMCVKILESSGEFQILEGESVVVTGRIRICEDEEVLKMGKLNLESKKCALEEDAFTLNSEDFYKELRLRGYEYGPTFQGVTEAETSGLKGVIRWENRWVSFMDAMLQIPILCLPKRALLLPTKIKSVRIDPRKLPENTKDGIPFAMYPYINMCCAGPVEIQGIHCGVASRRINAQDEPVLEEYVFVPHFDSCILSEEEKNEIEEYSHVCSTLAHQILTKCGKSKKEISDVLNGFREAPHDVTDKYNKSDDKKHIISKVLLEILDTDVAAELQENVKTVYNKYQADMQCDMFTNVSLREFGLRSALDIVQDNIVYPKLNILEVSAKSVFHSVFAKMLGMSTLGMVKLDYKVARITADPIPEGVLDAGVQVIQWDSKETELPVENDLIVAKDLFTDSDRPLEETLQAIAVATKERGFIYISERTNITPGEKFISVLTEQVKRGQNEKHLENAFAKVGLVLVAKKKDQITSVSYLLRKLTNAIENNNNADVVVVEENGEFSWLSDLKDKLKVKEAQTEIPNIWLAANQPTSGVLGLINSLRLEPNGKYLRCFLNATFDPNSKVPVFDLSNPFFQTILQSDLTTNIYKDGQWGKISHRLFRNESTIKPRPNAFLNAQHRGDLSSIRWIESPIKHRASNARTVNKNDVAQNPPNNKLLASVYYAPLNFKDVVLASGKLPPDAIPGDKALEECIMGLEFSGRDETGRRIMGAVEYQGMATTVEVEPDFVMEVPDHWTLEEASTVPVAYLTAFCALVYRGKLQKGESVLIHSGSGGVGQAAIRVALSMGCTVYVTVGSDEKREFLKEMFPQLEDKHFSNSRDVTFEYDILNATDGIGVDMVLNSLAEDKLQASIRCLKKNGRFLEIGKLDLYMDNKIGLSVFLKNITFHGIHIDHVFGEKELGIELMKFLSEGIRNGVIQPLKANVFEWNQGEEAFRFMASGKHMGKVVIKIREEEADRKAKPNIREVPSLLRTYCPANRSYVITGGLGGFGLELCNWLVGRGAKHMVISSRTGIKNGYQQLWFQRWEREGVQVKVSNEDISTVEGTTNLLNEAREMAPLDGIFHLAMVLHDGLLENLEIQDFQEVYSPKVKAVKHLDVLSRKLCPELQYFVAFSSIACGRGNPGQSNYSYANSVMERIIEQRRYQGLPGVAIQWGGIGDVGVVYERMGGNEVILKGSVPQRLNSCLATLDRVLQDDYCIVSSFVPVEKAAFGGGNEKDLLVLLCNVLGIKDPSTVKPDQTLGELGMDSIMGVEIKQVLETDYDTVLSMPEVRLLSISDLKKIGAEKKNVKSTGKWTEGMLPSLIMDPYVPTELIMPLNSVTGSSCVFFVHPIEGHTNMLKELGSRLLKPAYGLQFVEEVPSGSVQEMAGFYVQKIKSVQPYGPYHIVGFSYGTLIAQEMVLLLQKSDQVGTFICVDASPYGVAEGARNWLTDTGDKRRVKQAPFELFLKTYWRNVPPQVSDHFKNTSALLPYEKNIDFLVESVSSGLSRELISKVLDYTTRLARASKDYQPSGLFRGNATLIKSTQGETVEDVPASRLQDYGLKENVQGSVEILEVKGSHLDLIQKNADSTAKIINTRIME